ncbi:hypothetical protein F4810DRAFT_500651 [Camillea tinctor]|nr:hypothetical protein F4810DRAFT_500651 [Camillea tinctor]
MLSLDPMATTSSQPPANPANTPSIATVRASSASAPPPSESPAIPVPVPSPSLPGSVPNGSANGYLPPASMPSDGSINTDMRLYPRDGRVRNPVPSKLKDVNERMKGNFGVMHMDVASHRASEGRDAAAKRTSESTALQARLAQTDAYVSHQRRANYPRATGLKQFSPTKKPEDQVPDPGPRVPLTIAETKAEQARLLTLLRTLPPNLVVDQICKGLAFFGGIPDAPPPTDGKFPESAESNGSGSLFVGWIAEIFPSLEHPRKSTQSSVPPPSSSSASQRRPRGRPKGSKASKARSDKGIKKGSQRNPRGVDNQAEDAQDESWVDVEDSVLELNDNGDLVEAESSMRNAPSTPPRVPDIEPVTATPATGSTGGFRSINDTNNVPTSNTKRRGRPKGSKNRPKDNFISQTNTAAEPLSANSHPSTQATGAPGTSSQAPPKVTPVPVPVPILDTPAKKKGNSGRPKGTKNRIKPTNETTAQDASVSQQATNHNNNPHGQFSTQAFAAINPGLTDSYTSSTANGAAGQDKHARMPVQSGTPTSAASQLPPTTHQVKPSSVTGKKRKRQGINPGSSTPKGESPITTGGGGMAISQQAQPTISQGMPVSQLQNHPGQPEHQSVSVSGVAPIPPAKRSRKSQEANSTPTMRRQTPNNSIGQKSSIPSVNLPNEPPRQPNQVGVAPQNHVPAEGLEAHYAAMQSRTDQMQSYNSGRPQQKQQHPPATSISSTASPISASNQIPAEGLEAHFERFAALQNQNLQDNSRQTSSSRQQKQAQTSQTASPISAQASKTSQLSATLASQQQARVPQGYYAQAQTLNPSYNTQQPSYPTNQRQQSHMASSSPGTALVHHVTNSPQFGAQSNSPLMQADSSYRGSPSLVHSTAGFAPRRTPSASPLDNSAYRPASATSHGLSNHSPHFGTRQPPTTTHSTSHPGLPTSFSSFSDPSFIDMQSLDSGNSHSSLGLGTGSYGLGSGSLPQQQRTSSSSAATLYSPATSMNTNYLGSSSLGRASQNRWPS